MGIKSLLSRPFARLATLHLPAGRNKAIRAQEKIFRTLLNQASGTAFAAEHGFTGIKTYGDFKKNVPVREYENFIPYIDRIMAGESHVLWRGRPLYMAKTSGTTSGVKYIPITRDSIHNHIRSARNALLMYIRETGRAEFADGKMIFFSGSPELEEKNGIYTGRLSGIVNHYVPAYLRKNQVPSYKTNCIPDWETKVDAIVEETLHSDMRLISGIPPWVQMYFEKLEKRTGKKAGELFPRFSLFVYGGVHYEPYRAQIEKSIGRKVDSIELYPASEGFIAYQDSQDTEGMLLITGEGIFYEFIPASEYHAANPSRISLKDVQAGINYALVLSTNAGLWGYSIGDTVKFVSTDPYRIIVTGRVKHFISAFGEHVIAEEVEAALLAAAKDQNISITEFTVAPQVSPPESGLPYHEWFIEFDQQPADPALFLHTLEQAMISRNIYYRDLLKGNVLRSLKIRMVQKNGFISYMKETGRLGGQNKVPRLSNDRQIADGLRKFIAGDME